MTYLLWRGSDKEDEARRLDGFFRISMQLPADFATMAMIDVMSSTGGRDMAKIAKIRSHPAYKAWIAKFGAAMTSRMERG